MPASCTSIEKNGPGADCPLCPRLVAFRQENRAAFGDWHNSPVPAFGGQNSSLLILGLAPGLRGANRTGRPFTGDYAGDLLYPTLFKYGFAQGRYGATANDGLTLVDCRISNAVRCVPPQNKPTGAEIAACRPFLEAELAALPRLRAILALGAIAHRAAIAALGERQAAFPFGHGNMHRLGPLLLADSYHCSRYNTNTGRLTTAMFESVVAALRTHLGPAPAPLPPTHKIKMPRPAGG